MRALGLAAVLILSSRGLRAQPQSPSFIRRSLSGTVGVVHTQNEGTGMGMTGAFALNNAFAALTLTPVDLGIMPQDPNGRFRSETFSNGNTICRDHTTGQFADDANCGPRIVAAASADFVAALPIGSGRSVAAGVGYRAGNSAGTYGLAAVHFGPMYGTSWRLSSRFGRSFFDLGIGGAIPIGAKERAETKK